jgi:murein DD-endopeptidase MepM/ murein hydrolase activator NlpD
LWRNRGLRPSADLLKTVAQTLSFWLILVGFGPCLVGNAQKPGKGKQVSPFTLTTTDKHAVLTHPHQGEVIPIVIPRAECPQIKQGAYAVLANPNVRLYEDEKNPKAITSRKIPLYSQLNGDLMGLMPVGHDDTPGAFTLTLYDGKGTPFHSAPIQIQDVNFSAHKQQILLTSKMKELAEVGISPYEKDTIVAAKQQSIQNPERSWPEFWKTPIDVFLGCVKQTYGGARYYPVKQGRKTVWKYTGKFHNGIDTLNNGVFKALMPGIVRVAKREAEFPYNGGTIIVDAGQGVTYSSSHLDQIMFVQEGQRVNAGQELGIFSQTGFATGIHPHIVISVHGIPVNPGQWIHNLHPCSPRKSKIKKTKPAFPQLAYWGRTRLGPY